ncbi:MAG: Spherulation-specific family 4-domain-containing protein [Monoraphidium minutum]|nr:MAG: Spherulation-specific family 4-domain-containing protein [Monoraphidium minutum]
MPCMGCVRPLRRQALRTARPRGPVRVARGTTALEMAATNMLHLIVLTLALSSAQASRVLLQGACPPRPTVTCAAPPRCATSGEVVQVTAACSSDNHSALLYYYIAPTRATPYAAAGPGVACPANGASITVSVGAVISPGGAPCQYHGAATFALTTAPVWRVVGGGLPAESGPVSLPSLYEVVPQPPVPCGNTGLPRPTWSSFAPPPPAAPLVPAPPPTGPPGTDPGTPPPEHPPLFPPSEVRPPPLAPPLAPVNPNGPRMGFWLPVHYPNSPEFSEMVASVEAAAACAKASLHAAVLTGPNSGAPEPGDPWARAAFARVAGRPGWTTFGYVSTRYGQANLSDLFRQVNTWLSFKEGYYGDQIQGIWLDQSPSTFTERERAFYITLINYIRSYGKKVALNPGVDLQDCEIAARVDYVNAYEQSHDAWAAADPKPSCTCGAATTCIASLHGYGGAADVGSLAALMRGAAAAGFKAVHVTDRAFPDHYAGLPTFWREELAAACAVNT